MKKRVSLALESYLEAIAVLQEEHGAAGTAMLADKMQCKRSSVTSALRRLSEHGLINYQPYKPVTLTEKGRANIKKLDKYHAAIKKFLLNVLAFEEEYAEQEACKLEHQMLPETIERLSLYNDFLESRGFLENDAFKLYIKGEPEEKKS